VSYAHHIDCQGRIIELVAALSDTPLTSGTHAWFIGHTRNAAVLELRLAGLVPDAVPITRSDRVAAWARRRHSATVVLLAPGRRARAHGRRRPRPGDHDDRQRHRSARPEGAPDHSPSTSPRMTGWSPRATVKR
jgi:hypothetical protein